MADHWTIGDECSVCPSCGTALDSPAEKCPNEDCPTNKKKGDK